mmetsp:Transcript_6460/g.15153  ORF Transcript_6460/g.15153 Transcript_6460/m.15153 type:complete len:93 (+) Transcript_6460:783-1061(+)
MALDVGGPSLWSSRERWEASGPEGVGRLGGEGGCSRATKDRKREVILCHKSSDATRKENRFDAHTNRVMSMARREWVVDSEIKTSTTMSSGR